MRRLKATAQTVHFGFLDGSLAPVFEVESGEEFWINTVSADPEHDVPRDWIPKAIPEIFERAPRGTGPHILTGPIAVKGAQPGDVPTAPFFGQLAVAPPREWGRLDSRPPLRHGGNMDNKDLRPGTRLFLPVAVDGALFSAGDGHAAQGHGEINQTAIETSLDGRFRLTARRECRSTGRLPQRQPT